MNCSSLSAADPKSAARSAGLRYVDDRRPGITRITQGKGVSYRDSAGRTIRDGEPLTRILSLAVLPAWREVWICRVCRKCYIHPEVVNAYLDGTLAKSLNR